MKKHYFLFLLGLIVLGIFLANSFILATPSPISIRFTNPIINGGDFDEMLERVLSWLWPFSLVIGALMLIVAGYSFVFSGGDPEKATTGRRIAVYALIGVTIITVARGIAVFVREVLTDAAGDPIPPEELIPAIASWAFGFLIFLSALGIIFSGYVLVTSAGDPERISRGRRWLMYSLIGAAIGIMSRGLVTLIVHLVEP
jgi:hypothetical protein